MKRTLSLPLLAGLAAIGTSLFSAPTLAVVAGDLLTNSSETSGWQNCAEGGAILDQSFLDAGGCAYRETPIESGNVYKMTCGVTTTKYSSITLAFLDANDVTVATETTEIFEDATGPYSVILAAPAGSTTAAVGIYGEHGSGFQDCVLVVANPAPQPTDGSISGTAWFDGNLDGTFDASEAIIPGTAVSIFQNGALIAQTQTDLDGNYIFGGLDVDQCYNLLFAPADPTLQFGANGGDNDATNDGATLDICLSDTNANVVDIDAGFEPVPPVVPPADYAVCGLTWLDNNANGTFDDADVALSDVDVELLNLNSGDSHTFTSNARGHYVFSSLVAGDYKLQFTAPDGHVFTAGSGVPLQDGSFAMENGMTAQFILPDSSNTDADAACTIQDANAGFIREPVALDPTIATDDEIEGLIGESLAIAILENDEPCNGAVSEVDLIGHTVPGDVTYNISTREFLISNTTEAGSFAINYGLRGACGSYDTAVVWVTLEAAPPPPPPLAPAEPWGCQIETGGAAWGGVDIFSQTEFGFSSQYNLYDADENLVFTGSSNDVSHHVFFNGQWEIEWTGLHYGFDQLSIYYVSAMENGVESNRVACPRRAISPIALDVDDSGSVEYVRGDFQFDLSGDSIDEHLMSWFGPAEGILINKDFGDEISGEHLFGNVDGEFEDGFAKLGQLDLNNDSMISGEELESLAIWTDRNSNTRVDDGEISSIASHRIVSLPVDHYKFFARAALENGNTMIMQDLWFPMAPLARLAK